MYTLQNNNICIRLRESCAVLDGGSPARESSNSTGKTSAPQSTSTDGGLSEPARVEEGEELGVVHIGVLVRHHHSLLSKTQQLSVHKWVTQINKICPHWKLKEY